MADYERQRVVDWGDQVRRTRRRCVVAFLLDIAILAATISAVCVTLLLLVGVSGSKVVSPSDGLPLIVPIIVVALAIALACCGITALRANRSALASVGGVLVRQETGVVHDVVEEMAVAAGCGMPDVYVASTDIPNAYATSNGRRSAIVVTSGLLRVVDRDGLQGVVGHEMGHLVSGDCPAMTKLVALTSLVGLVSATFLRLAGHGPVVVRKRDDDDDDSSGSVLTLVMLVVCLLFIICAPLLSKLVESKSSRDRERRADAWSVALTRNPTALARALLALDATEPVEDASNERFYDKSAALAFRVPGRLEDGRRARVTDTHPTTEERVQALVDMGADTDMMRRPVRVPVADVM